MPPSQRKIRLALGGFEHVCLVDAEEDPVAGLEMRLELLALLDRELGLVELPEARESHHPSRQQIAIGHRMSHHRDLAASGGQAAGEMARHLGLATARAHRRHRDDRKPRSEHARARTHEQEIRPERQSARGCVHHLDMSDVAVGEHHAVDRSATGERLELGLGQDRDPLGVERPGERRRVASARQPGDLGRGEGHHLACRIGTKHHVEDVEVAAPGPQDHGRGAFDAHHTPRFFASPPLVTPPRDMRLVLFLAKNAAIGVIVGWMLLAALLWFDVARLGELLLASEHGLLTLLLAMAGFAVTFGSLAMGTAIFLLPRE
ncbi:MAG: hypothetical protein NZ555_00420 [Geminicoccaceae bacterium]|nr:hypothetical protein [Geminicoccaceae bacterium]